MISLYGDDRENIVEGNMEVNELGGEKICQKIRCTCQKFENIGILCDHAIKALDSMNVMEIPERYILGRWRLDAKSGEIKGGKVEVDENDPKLEILARYRDLCPRMVKLATQASVYKSAYQLVDEGIKELCTKVNKMMVSFDDLGDCGNGNNIDMTSNPNFA